MHCSLSSVPRTLRKTRSQGTPAMGATTVLPARCLAEQADCRKGVSFVASKGQLKEWDILGLCPLLELHSLVDPRTTTSDQSPRAALLHFTAPPQTGSDSWVLGSQSWMGVGVRRPGK